MMTECTVMHYRRSCHQCRLTIVPLLSFTNTAPPHIYTLSLHDALPISRRFGPFSLLGGFARALRVGLRALGRPLRDRKSTRLNFSHEWISYAVFCLKKKKS